MDRRTHLRRIFDNCGFGHPSWFVRIVERIARRRFVSFAEIEGRIADWYSDKYWYPKCYLYQHGILRQLDQWRLLGGVVGGRFCSQRWYGDARFGLLGLHCKLDANSQRVDSQHCKVCGVGINPVFGGRGKHRLTCRSPVCHDIYTLNHRRRARRSAGALYFTVEAELRPVVEILWYLESSLQKKAGSMTKVIEKEYERTTAGLRDLLFDTILDIRHARISSKDAAAVASLAKEMIATVDLELKVSKQLVEADPEAGTAITLAPPTVKLLPAKR